VTTIETALTRTLGFGDRVKARVCGNQLVSAIILREKNGWFGKKYLVSYSTRHTDGPEYLYETQDCEWVRASDVFPCELSAL